MEPWLIGAAIGLVVGLAAMFMANAGESSRDRVVFRPRADVYGTARAWAEHHGYKIQPAPSGEGIVARRGTGFATAPKFVSVENRGDEFKIEGWIAMPGLGKKREIAFSAPGMTGKLPRQRGLEELNSLLGALGQPPLQKR